VGQREKTNTHVFRPHKSRKLSYFRVRFICKSFYSLHFDGLREKREREKDFFCYFGILNENIILQDTL